MEGFQKLVVIESKAILKTFSVKIIKKKTKSMQIFKYKDRRTSTVFISILHKVVPSSIKQSFVEGLLCARCSLGTIDMAGAYEAPLFVRLTFYRRR